MLFTQHTSQNHQILSEMNNEIFQTGKHYNKNVIGLLSYGITAFPYQRLLHISDLRYISVWNIFSPTETKNTSTVFIHFTLQQRLESTSLFHITQWDTISEMNDVF